jgi:hypothetical protein
MTSLLLVLVQQALWGISSAERFILRRYMALRGKIAISFWRFTIQQVVSFNRDQVETLQVLQGKGEAVQSHKSSRAHGISELGYVKQSLPSRDRPDAPRDGILHLILNNEFSYAVRISAVPHRRTYKTIYMNILNRMVSRRGRILYHDARREEKCI